MSQQTIDRLIINSPYEEPSQHWSYSRESRTFSLAAGRRAAGYVVASPNARAFDDPGVFVEIPLVNQIRPRVAAWRAASYPGVTSVTKRLLEHWRDEKEFERRRFFFCQLEAIETLIWVTEAPLRNAWDLRFLPMAGHSSGYVPSSRPGAARLWSWPCSSRGRF